MFSSTILTPSSPDHLMRTSSRHSEGSGSVYNITFENLTLNGTGCGVHIKSRPSRGGVMDGIFYRNSRAHNVYRLVDVDMGGACRSNASGFCSAATKPTLNNVWMENVTFTADVHLTNHTPPLKSIWGGIDGKPHPSLTQASPNPHLILTQSSPKPRLSLT